MITVPDELTRALSHEGETAARWVQRFPRIAEDCLRRWHCVPDGPLRNGALAVVIPVRSPHGPAVIKISYPHPASADEHRALEVWQGAGAVQLFDHDPDRRALLLERVQDRRLDLNPDEGIAVGGELAAQLAVTAPPDMPHLADTTEAWQEQVRRHDRLAGAPLPGAVLDAALATIGDLGQDRTPSMLHGDLHASNILRARRGWVVIDPKGMAGTVAYDALTMISYRMPKITGGSDPVGETLRRIAIFSGAAGVDRALAERCVHARAVTALLWDLSRGPVPRSPNYAFRVALAEGLLRSRRPG